MITGSKRTKGSTRVIFLSDTHCGSMQGLTAPKWATTETQKDLWNMYTGWIKQYKPFDIVICVGDMLDGKSVKDGGIGLISSDRIVQIEMAEVALRALKCPEIHIIGGTDYHVNGSGSEDWELILAKQLNATYADQGFFDIHGCQINARHKVGGGGLPHTKYTPLAKEVESNLQWAMSGEQVLSDLLVRGHVHKYSQISNGHTVAFTLPAMQSAGSRYGTKQCSGLVDWGMLVVDISGKKEFEWKVLLADSSLQQAAPSRLR